VQTFGTSSGETGMTSGSADLLTAAATIWVFLWEETLLIIFFLSWLERNFEEKVEGLSSLSTRSCKDPEEGDDRMELWIDLVVATTCAIFREKDSVFYREREREMLGFKRRGSVWASEKEIGEIADRIGGNSEGGRLFGLALFVSKEKERGRFLF
jgi:hypothetical protein